ncbi:hypothetical protein HMF7854_00255 [Sphingomonas ginkgonis]|uniref:Uncharacterized protein n=1 Tax=Sphingomonas ginkgonis TaxID=2315330 RepID=A0A3R9Z492_9SPHN|nr:hypothetical protein [Sphingomonas ginkgonis]RST29434.1 hypothetical protein HMF7854_00255 [Sphingomonas ginkgonis]
MSKRKDVVPPEPRAERAWTRVEDYTDPRASFRRYASRARRRVTPGREPAAPRFSLGTLPFVVLIVLLAVLAVGIFVSAIPTRETFRAPEPRREQGTAPPGWLRRAGITPDR